MPVYVFGYFFWEGGLPNLYEEVQPRGQTTYTFVYHIDRKGAPFVYLILRKGTPFTNLLRTLHCQNKTVIFSFQLHGTASNVRRFTMFYLQLNTSMTDFSIFSCTSTCKIPEKGSLFTWILSILVIIIITLYNHSFLHWPFYFAEKNCYQNYDTLGTELKS